MTNRRDFIRQAGLLTALGAGFSQPAVAGISDTDKATQLRDQLLIPKGKIYLNTGSLGPSPKSVLQAVIEAMNRLESDPVSENWGPLGEAMEKVRLQAAAFVGCQSDEMVLTRNTTEGLSLIAQGLALREGDEILTSTLEHRGGEVPLEYLVATRGAVLRKIEIPLPPDNEDRIVETVTKALSPRTRLVMLSHVNTITGCILPLRRLADVLHQRDIIFIVDGAQALGMFPIRLNETGVDAWAASGHKWLLGPKETGLLYVSKSFQPSVKPLFLSAGYGTYTEATGTRNVAVIAGLGAAFSLHEQLGRENLWQDQWQRRLQCHQMVSQLKGVTMLSPTTQGLASSIVSFSVAGFTNQSIYQQLKAQNVVVKVMPALNGVRISCHAFVSEDDIKKFVDLTRAIIS